MSEMEDHFYWGKQLLACFDELRLYFKDCIPSIIDCEVIPHFDGRPDDLFIWLICERSDNVAFIKEQTNLHRKTIQNQMKNHGFPSSAIETIGIGATSLEDIDAGGGRFYYFR